MGKYVFTHCSFRVEWREDSEGETHFFEMETPYPNGPRTGMVGLDTSILAVALNEKLGLTLKSTVDNYFTFNVSENITIHPSVIYTCNVVDGGGKPKQIDIKVSAIKHIGVDVEQQS